MATKIFSVGQRVRVKIGLDDCPQHSNFHSRILEGRTGTIVALDDEGKDNHIYVVTKFLPPFLAEGAGFKSPWAVPVYNWFAPTELEVI